MIWSWMSTVAQLRNPNLKRNITIVSVLINISKHFTRVSLSYRITVDFSNYRVWIWTDTDLEAYRVASSFPASPPLLPPVCDFSLHPISRVYFQHLRWSGSCCRHPEQCASHLPCWHFEVPLQIAFLLRFAINSANGWPANTLLCKAAPSIWGPSGQRLHIIHFWKEWYI